MTSRRSVGTSADGGLPPSATHVLVATAGLLAFVGTTTIIAVFEPFGHDVVRSAGLVILVTALGIAVPDMLWQRVHLRPTTGLDFGIHSPSVRRTAVKLLGLLGSVGGIGAIYLLAPEYHGTFYDNYYRFLGLIWPWWAVLAAPYFYLVDRRMPRPEDGYWHMGRLLLGKWREVDRAILLQHWLGWIIKGFFMPLMFTYLCDDLIRLWKVDVWQFSGFLPWYEFAYQYLYMIDVGLVCVGYLFSLRLLDSHVRSAEPTLLGWLVALICYEPFWTAVGSLYFRYWNDFTWTTLFADSPVLLVVWGCAILFLSVVYVWATVVFGIRFSNLTHRGIITNGPYRFTKHPAYISKNLSWWLISIPFATNLPTGEIVRNCLLLVAINLVYLMRAKTEERHLGRDPVYVQYAAWIDQHGMLRFVRRIPLLGRFTAFRPPQLSGDAPVKV